MALAIGFTGTAAALLTASVFAFMDAQDVYSPYGINNSGAYSGGMMGGMYSDPQSPVQPNQAATTYPYQLGLGGCHGRGISHVG